MLSTTVTVTAPGLTVSLVSTATLLCTETMITTQSPEVSEPEYRDSVTLPATAAGTVITQRVTGPPTAPSLNVPRATLPAAAVSFSSAGITVRVPWAGGDEDDADVDADGDGDVGEDGAGFETVACAEAAAGLTVDPSAGTGDAVVPAFVPGLWAGDDGPPAGAEEAPRAGTPPPRATGAVGVRCEPPSISKATIPPSTTAPAAVATAAAARGRRRMSCHHRGPGGTAGLGNPLRPNGPAR